MPGELILAPAAPDPQEDRRTSLSCRLEAFKIIARDLRRARQAEAGSDAIEAGNGTAASDAGD